MMRREIAKKTVWFALAGLVLAAPMTLTAQPEGRRGFHGSHRGEGPGAMMRELDLSDEQRAQIRALFERGTMRETLDRLRTRREALNEAVDNGADEATLRQLAYEVGTAEGDSAVERARIQEQMMGILTPEQQEQLKELRAERKQNREARKKRFEERHKRHRAREPEDS